MRRVVRIRVWLPRHDVEVEGVVEDDAVLELRVRCCTCDAQAHVLYSPKWQNGLLNFERETAAGLQSFNL